MVLTLLERQTRSLQNTLILSTPMSQNNTVGGPASYNSNLEHWCPMVVKGLTTKCPKTIVAKLSVLAVYRGPSYISALSNVNVAEYGKALKEQH